MKRNLIPTALSCVLAVACQGGGDSKKSSLPGVEVRTEVTEASGDEQVAGADGTKFAIRAERAVQLRDDMANLEVFADRLNEHEITVSATPTAAGAVLACKKNTGQSLEVQQVSAFSGLSGSASVGFVLEPTDADAVTVDCAVTDATNRELLSFSKTLRKGYVVRGTQQLRGLGTLDMDTLVLLEKSELLYGATDVALKVGTLVSQGAAISTFRKSDVTKTLPRMEGESGGRLTLTAASAIGAVTFNLRGKNGGLQDQRPKDPTPKPRAADGNCGRGNCNGADGARGDDAVNGFDGFHGGASGQVVLNVVNPTDLEVRFIYEPGKGSVGTPPSNPGRGGRGGAADSITIPGRRCTSTFADDDTKCTPESVRTGKPGNDGADGALGVPGLDGSDGQNLRSILNFEASGFVTMVSKSWSTLEGDL